MKDKDKKEDQCINELKQLHQRSTKLEKSETERKRAEEALKESEERYRTLVETIPHGIQEIDASGIITLANSAYHRILGYREGELIGKSIFDLIASDSERKAFCDYLTTYVKEQPVPIPWVGKNLTKDGRVIDVKEDWNYKGDEQGGITGFISVLTDITDRKRAEETLKEYSQRLEEIVEQRTKELRNAQEELVRKEKFAILEQLAGGVGHDLRNPPGGHQERRLLTQHGPR